MLGGVSQCLTEQRFEFIQPGFIVITSGESGRPAELLDDWIQRTVGMIWRALIADAEMILYRQMVDQRLYDS